MKQAYQHFTAAEVASWPKCEACADPAFFTVDWCYPQRVPDLRPACCAECAAKLLAKPRTWAHADAFDTSAA